MPLARRVMLLLAVLGLVGGCYVPDQEYHRVCSTTVCSQDDLLRAVPALEVKDVDTHGWGGDADAHPVKTKFYRAWLEYREDGAMFDPIQKQAIMARLDKLANAGKPIFVVFYVHGWHHNADDSNNSILNNAVKFNNLMARQVDELHRLFEQRSSGDVPEVLGIYVGWRGQSDVGTIPEMLTLGGRADVADKIGYGKQANPAWRASTNPPTDLAEDFRDIATKVHAVNSDSRILVMGHSLGGRLLTSAFLRDFTRGEPRPAGPGSLIVTINAAIGADCFDGAHLKPPVKEGIPPTWVNITSEDDTATALGYPLASRFGMARPCNALSPSSHATIGHYGDYVTHYMSFTSYGGYTGPVPTSPDHAKQAGLPGDLPIKSGESQWYQGEPHSLLLAYPYLDPTCDRSGRCYNHGDNAYYKLDFESRNIGALGSMWNIETDKSAIDFDVDPDTIGSRHNGYVETNLTRLLVELAWAS